MCFRRRNYDGTSSIFLLRLLRNFDQHFHDQTNEAVLSLRLDNTGVADAAEWLADVKARVPKQREAISDYLMNKFPVLILSLWVKLRGEGDSVFDSAFQSMRLT